jgi:hypothetical protein
LIQPTLLKMSSILYNYFPQPKKDPKTGRLTEVLYPYIPIRLSYKHQFCKNPLLCLVDSGSERNLFPAIWGEAAKINIKRGQLKNIFGIGEIKIKAYTHEIKLIAENFVFITFADFSYEQEVPLLGRHGFFDHFKAIIFKEKKKVFELVL